MIQGRSLHHRMQIQGAKLEQRSVQMPEQSLNVWVVWGM